MRGLTDTDPSQAASVVNQTHSFPMAPLAMASSVKDTYTAPSGHVSRIPRHGPFERMPN